MQLLLRLLFSLLFFNIGPFFIFAFGYYLFGLVKGDLDYWLVVLCGLASLAVFAPYRIHHAVVAVRHGLFYEKAEWDKIAGERTYRTSFIGHTMAVVFYFSPLFVVWLIAKA